MPPCFFARFLRRLYSAHSWLDTSEQVRALFRSAPAPFASRCACIEVRRDVQHEPRPAEGVLGVDSVEEVSAMLLRLPKRLPRRLLSPTLLRRVLLSRVGETGFHAPRERVSSVSSADGPIETQCAPGGGAGSDGLLMAADERRLVAADERDDSGIDGRHDSGSTRAQSDISEAREGS